MPQITAADQALVTTFGRLLEAQAHLAGHLGRALEQDADLPHTWFEVLLRIKRADDGRITMTALAQQVALTAGGITKMIDRMMQAGLVERVPCPTDRRVAYAALTRQGTDKLDQALPGHAKQLRQAFAQFTEQELHTFDQLLDRLRAVQLD
jgi:MarR family 2-MHQ and catechol resistance regulon transcriptional repressor